jgi:hypothetical protein
VTARDAAGLTGTATLRVTRTGVETKRVAEAPTAVAPAPAPTSTNPLKQAAQSSTAAGNPPASPSPVSYPLPTPEIMSAPLPQPTPAQDRAPVVSPRRGPEMSEILDLNQERQPPRPPVVKISAPSAADEMVTEDATITLAGTAREATAVMWTTNYGSSGTAIGSERWSVPNFALPVGQTVVTVTARNAVGDLATDTLTITRRSSNPVKLEITSPTADSAWVAPSSTVALRGVASDNVVRVTWQADWGGTGTAVGTQTWSISTIGLQIGVNKITVTAHDADGRTSRRVVTVRYQRRVASSR